ncbi:hypothetical protein Poly51_37810 [Rubripirellula tenax]|uniref:Uncharacterized protein n=1 Tax=Rubripirellula tenax TaxID=2528015 RepID=A0A5C6EMX2_9BACT|nr:hypothetical protein [Rubripirellula tenax]TWU50492.1 hypothetical protein Poly51_37810 [Rubripirellula tenax]
MHEKIDHSAFTVWDRKAGTPLRQIDAAQTGSITALAPSPDAPAIPYPTVAKM